MEVIGWLAGQALAPAGCALVSFSAVVAVPVIVLGSPTRR
jgi:hypothetical protein